MVATNVFSYAMLTRETEMQRERELADWLREATTNKSQ